MTKQKQILNKIIDLAYVLELDHLSEYDWTYFAVTNNRDTHISYHLVENGSKRTASEVYETYSYDADPLDVLRRLKNEIMRKWRISHKDGC